MSDLFVGLALQAQDRFKVERRSAHLDATSFAVDGDYASEPEALVEGAPVPIRVTHGYSRDHRPDLKQFVMNLVCWGDGDIPAFLELADGNQSDKARFADLLLAFKQQWQFEGLYVADSALYSAENLQALRGLQWLTRVPLTLTAATDLVSTLPDAALAPTGMRGYRMTTVCSEYSGVRQRWFVVESEARRQADLAALERTLATGSKCPLAHGKARRAVSWQANTANSRWAGCWVMALQTEIKRLATSLGIQPRELAIPQLQVMGETVNTL